ncbi:bifunctional ADP-dependent NAD(P)H-hydrate dehydratase/NAD(P)H-hydrate epimerase [Chitinimonas koreensis]|uniref:bifunctional ADP-dependent NAD(P)H-hydrate dehydratase/NAD(P)H-hydrate epimerase n=1 Tax=Chitinimonas koreensis TaxID=356302 RepID=UPI00041BAD80|nr:bifunctional ADP-dependent NAD(P)H-hydrate dehydratase/NAD(P)H-hydrate epimerase [Chitinimonas koreensis]QNM97596.1 bifunctional ADP-dependent NAD(P)H-hydrate dehydratase/NAD(P)H-hydrate epimerase [Chitinimonas koreensis]
MFYTLAQLRGIEQRALALGLPLMQRAGQAAADFAAARIDPAAPVTVLAGPGNNGGDALVAATALRRYGHPVELVMPAGPDGLPADAAQAYRNWRAAGGVERATLPDAPAALLVDGLFGLGLNRPLPDHWQALIHAANAQGAPILALDVPSGIAADRGTALGEPIRADWTLNFIGTARGLVTGAAVDACGEIHLATLDLPDALRPPGEVGDTAELMRAMRLERPRDSHKGRFGSVAVLGGAAGMAGAALLAGRAALHAGAGKVYAGLLDPAAPRVDFGRPELMLRTADAALLDAADVLVVGPGLGREAAARDLLVATLAQDKPLLLDADALNLLALEPALFGALQGRHAATVLTPHPTEAARLLCCNTATVQADRYGAAARLAETTGATVVLKGAGTLLAEAGGDGTDRPPTGRSAVNRSGGAALANAGQGDVLGGIVGALLAQGLDGWQAAAAAVRVHGLASDRLVARDGRLATLAGEVAEEAGRVLGAWAAGRLDDALI